MSHLSRLQRPANWTVRERRLLSDVTGSVLHCVLQLKCQHETEAQPSAVS